MTHWLLRLATVGCRRVQEQIRVAAAVEAVAAPAELLHYQPGSGGGEAIV